MLGETDSRDKQYAWCTLQDDGRFGLALAKVRSEGGAAEHLHAKTNNNTYDVHASISRDEGEVF